MKLKTELFAAIQAHPEQYPVNFLFLEPKKRFNASDKRSRLALLPALNEASATLGGFYKAISRSVTL